MRTFSFWLHSFLALVGFNCYLVACLVTAVLSSYSVYNFWPLAAAFGSIWVTYRMTRAHAQARAE